MRHFIALFCLVALASADKLGYNYQPVAHSNLGLSFAPGAAASHEAPSFAAAPAFAASGPAFAASGPAFAAGGAAPAAVHENFGFEAAPSAVQPAFSASGPVAAPSAEAPTYAAQPELEKEFYTYTADEGDFHEPASSDQVANNLKKSLRVIFVRGPEHSSVEDAALALAKQASQQETAIYVLNKQADIGALANKLNSVGAHQSNKPEVHFVKYRTNEDAANAQRAIQGQYDQLGGTSATHDGGVAKSLDFASKAPQPAASAPAAAIASSPIAAAAAPAFSAEPEATGVSAAYVPPPPAPGSSYLPANILRLFRL